MTGPPIDAPDLAEVGLVGTRDQNRVRARGPRIDHGQALTTAQEVDFHEVNPFKKQTLPF